MSHDTEASQEAKALEMKAAMERGLLPSGLGGIVTFDDCQGDEKNPRFDYIKIVDVIDTSLALDSETALSDIQRMLPCRMAHSNGQAYCLRVFARVESGKFTDTS